MGIHVRVQSRQHVIIPVSCIAHVFVLIIHKQLIRLIKNAIITYIQFECNAPINVSIMMHYMMYVTAEQISQQESVVVDQPISDADEQDTDELKPQTKGFLASML